MSFNPNDLQQLTYNTKTNINTWSYRNTGDSLATVLGTGYFTGAYPIDSEYGWANSIIFCELSDGFFTLQVGSTQVTATAVASLPVALATSQATPADPAGTADAVGKMMGLGATITPAVTGKVMIVVSGSILNDTNTDGASVQIRTGTGAAPANGDALTGTARGAKVSMVNTVAAQRFPFSVNAVVTGLTVGTSVWIDAGVAAITGGTASIKDVSISVIEV